MIERLGGERLLEMLLVGTPDRVVDALVAASPQDAEVAADLRGSLALLASAAPPIEPPASLRARILGQGARPRRPKRPAIVVVDMLNDHLAPGGPLEVPRARDIVPALKRRIEEARSRFVPVIYVCDAHAPGDPDFRDWPLHAVVGTPGAEVWPELAPIAADTVVSKRTYSGFAGTELGPLLARLGTDEVILTGCATEIQLFATAVEALQRGFVVTIPPDCQAGATAIAEQVTLVTLSTMPPFEPLYLRDDR